MNHTPKHVRQHEIVANIGIKPSFDLFIEPIHKCEN